MSSKPAPAPNRRAALAPMAARLLAELRRVRDDAGDAEAVHDARVSARRLQACSELWLPARAGREELIRRLRKVVRRLGKVRNLDVALELLKVGAKADQTARKKLSVLARRERKAERRELGDWVTRPRIRRVKLAALSAMDDDGVEDIEKPDTREVARRVRRILTLLRDGNPLADTGKTHEIRREVRLLRYAHEALESEYPAADFAAAQEMFVRLQDAAGEWHDRDRLLKFIADSGKKVSSTESGKALQGRLEMEMKEFGERFVEDLALLIRLKPALVGGFRSSSK